MPATLTELDLRRRNCRVCTRWKHAVDFPWRWKARGQMLPIPYILTICLACKAERENARYHALSQEEKKEKGRKANRQAWERRNKLKNEVARLEKRTETLEQRLVKYRQRYGVPKRGYTGEILLDLLPLRMFLLRQARIREHGVSEIARIVEVDEAAVRRHVNGFYWESDCKPRPVRQVSLGVVDKYLVRLDAEERIDDLYPEVDLLLEEMFARVP